ncbi:MAG: hypothetical protein JW943_12040 [Deltaproteobacteria bacterium]|nr:hypothetical protein [Deltaproteobacteria bacterium]
MASAPPRNIDPHARLMAAFIIASVTVFFILRTAMTAMAGIGDPHTIVDMVFDDAYYYLSIAYNIAQHGMSTFDRLTETNGYHPLWLLILTGFEALFQFDKKNFYTFTLALIGIITIASLLYCMKKRRDPFSFSLAAGLSAGYAGYPFVWLYGLETILFAPLLLAVLHFVRKDGFVESRNKAALIFCAVILVRLDAACLLISYAAVLFYAMRKQQGIRQSIIKITFFVMPAFATLMLYFLINKMIFGIALPVSGVAKMIGAQPLSNWGIAYYYIFNMAPLLLPVILLVPAEILWGKFRHGAIYYGGLSIFFIANMVQYAYYGALSGWMPWPWYFYNQALFMILLVARIAFISLCIMKTGTPLSMKFGKAFTAGAVAVCSILVPILVHALMVYSYVDPTNSFSTFNRRNLDDLNGILKTTDSVTVAMGDRAGGLGYWAPENIRVFQLEGLVAGREYLDARRSDTAQKWLTENIKPDYLIVDRDAVPLIGPPGKQYYVIIEPIQGRVVFDHLVAFCFPVDAVVKKTERVTANPNLRQPDVQRFIFDFKKRAPCDNECASEIQRSIFAVEGPRELAMSVEYRSRLNRYWERLDRKIALKLRQYWPHSL